MKISYDPAKRKQTLELRGLDFEDAAEIFSGLHFDRIDDRYDYGETRVISTGTLNSVVIVLVWTERDTTRRIISMRKADSDERQEYYARLG